MDNGNPPELKKTWPSVVETLLWLAKSAPHVAAFSHVTSRQFVHSWIQQVEEPTPELEEIAEEELDVTIGTFLGQ